MEEDRFIFWIHSPQLDERLLSIYGRESSASAAPPPSPPSTTTATTARVFYDMGAAASTACDAETDKPMDASDIPDDVAAAKAEIVRLRALMKQLSGSDGASAESAAPAATEAPVEAEAAPDAADA